jgi:hypothetical protein
MQVIRVSRNESIWSDEKRECEIMERVERGRRRYFEREFYGCRWYEVEPPPRFRRRSLNRRAA